MNKDLLISRRQTYSYATLSVVFIVFIGSLFFAPFYFEGDQSSYNKAYDAVKGLSFIEAQYQYWLCVTSLEFGHFFIIWVTSGLGIEKNLVMAVTNGLLVLFLMRLFAIWRVSPYVAVLICITNFYLFVLYFTAERLKFGFLFFLMSVYCIPNKKKSVAFSFLAVISHMQLIVLYATLLFPKFLRFFIRGTAKFFLTLKFKSSGVILPLIVFFTLAFFIWWQLGEQLIYKFVVYSTNSKEENDSLALLRSLLFFGMTFLYTKKYADVTLKFIPLIIAIYFVGGERLNLFAYVIFMSYALTYKRGLNYGVLFTSIYFTYKSIDFILRIIETGQGY